MPTPLCSQLPSVQQIRTRVVLPGGTLAGVAQSPDVQVFDQLRSAQPNEAWYAPERSPTNPTRVEILSYQVPKDSMLIVTDYSFHVYRPSGLVPHGATLLPEGELRGVLGFQFLLHGKVPGVVNFEIEPVPSTFDRKQFRPPITGRMRMPNETTPGDFARRRATNYGSAAGTGTTLLPPRWGRHGDQGIPGAFPVYDSEQVTMTMVVYRPISIPLSLIEGRVVGYIGPRLVLDKLMGDLQNPLK